MDTTPLSTSYIEHVARLQTRLSSDEALRRAVGGEFVATGKLEYHLLRSRGLLDHHLVIDVGCGSGRLACQLAPFLGIRYIGCDVVPQLLSYARELCGRPDWRFDHTNGITIPCSSGEADFVCFFSVFTHLNHEDIFRYFRETYRVLRSGGQLVMSFLEFRLPTHWRIFMASVEGTRDDSHLNQFIDREAIHTWAAAAGFDVRGIFAGDTEYIPLPEVIFFEDGRQMNHAGSLGQSVAVLQKREFPQILASGLSTSGTEKPPVNAEMDGRSAGPAKLPHALPDAPLLNASALSLVAPGASAALGFIVGGVSDHRVLIRAIGPSLSFFGVANPLPTPILAVFAGTRQLAKNCGGWGGDEVIATAAGMLGAFSVPLASRDAALIISLSPGCYTAVVTGATLADQGQVLIEMYIMD